MNLINLLFMQLTLVIVVLGSLMTLVEKYLPSSIRQMFRYGKHAMNDNKPNKLVQVIEMPKSWFSHFYVFALVWSWGALLLAINVYFFEYRPNFYFIKYLDFSCGNERRAETSPLITLMALILMTFQCTRRFVETNFLQIFSKKSKINLTHYLCGYLHYYGVIVLILAKADGFMNGQKVPVFRIHASEVILVLIASAVFLFMWKKQYESNMILINLRKKKKTEAHLMPQGGWFEYLSSPHMTAEVGMYTALYALLHQNSSYFYCFAWVISNQFCNALLTHKWYKSTFPDYPKQRRAFIPFML